MKGIRKFFYFFVVVVAFLGTGCLYAQVIKGAAIAGMNLSQVDGDEIYGFNKVGINLGVAAIVPFADQWEASIETIFTQKGSYQGPHYNDSLTGEYRLRINYLEVPVLVHFNDKNKVIFGAGFSWGRLVHVEEYEHGNRVESTKLNSGPYSKNDYNAMVDLRFRIYKQLKFNVRYAYSLKKIRTRVYKHPFSNDSWTRNQFNNFWTFRLIYIFNEEFSERARQ